MSLLDENIYETTGFDVVAQKLCEELSCAGFSRSEDCYFKSFKYSELFGEFPKYHFDNLFYCYILFEEEQIFLKVTQEPQLCIYSDDDKLIEYKLPSFCYGIYIKLYQCHIDNVINIIKNIIKQEEEKCIKNIKILSNN